MNRRDHERYDVWIPVKLQAGSPAAELAVSYDFGAGGMRVTSSRELAVGSMVAVTFRVLDDPAAEQTIEGRVVRLERNEDDPGGPWPYRAALAFEEKAPGLEEALRAALSAQDAEYGGG